MTYDSLQPLSYQGRHSLIQSRLRDFIVRNRLKAGDRLPTEESLSSQLGVSRTAIREALRGLEALGILEAQHGVGRVVLPFSFSPILENLSYGLIFQNRSILQITEIRKALDAFFIESAMERLTEKDIDDLSAMVERMRERTEAGLDMEREDHNFHELLYRRCGNPLALQLFEISWKARLAARDQLTGVQEIPPGTVQEHREILKAIKQRDVARARELIVGHHWNIEERFRQEIARETSGASQSVA
jgi:DNA-binding FadR family transcriptional regulator